MTFIKETYDTLADFLKAIERPRNEVFNDGTLRSRDRGEEEFFGTKNITEARTLMRDGWTERAEEVKKEIAKFEAKTNHVERQNKTRPTSYVVGFAPHVPNAIRGLPNSMVWKEHTPMKVKVVRLTFSMTMNCGTKKEDIEKAGLCVLKLANMIEKTGVRVRVDVMPFFAYSGGTTVVCKVCVKNWREPMDIKKVAFPTAHPSMFRRFGFAWLETLEGLKERGFRYGYGTAIESHEMSKKKLKECGYLDENEYFINTTFAKDKGYNPTRVAEALGITGIELSKAV